jgi:hypothetical protein
MLNIDCRSTRGGQSRAKNLIIRGALNGLYPRRYPRTLCLVREAVMNSDDPIR